MALMAGHPDANEVAPRPRGGIRLMAEKVRDPKVSRANAGFTGYTEIQGIGDFRAPTTSTRRFWQW